MHKLILCISLFYAMQAAAQYPVRTVRGIVQDSTGSPLASVTVRLSSVVDTLKAITNDQGAYQFPAVASLEFKLTFSLLSYQIAERSHVADRSQRIVQVPPMLLKPQINLLKEVIVYTVIPIQIKGDTIQYAAAAYPVRAGALTEELIRKLPGMQVNRNGRITSQGQPVTHVKVNGKTFFGGDVLTATRNLPADIVDNIQVIDDYGEQASITGIKNSEPEKVINIVLKKDRNRGMFGQVTGGGGTAERYIGSFSLNRFRDGQEMSVLGSLNNTNTSIMSFGDVRGSGARDRSGYDLNSMFDQTDGINTTRSMGFNFADSYANGITVSGAYSFVDKRNRTEATSLLQSIFPNYSIFTNDDRLTTADDIRHKLFGDIEFRIDTSNYLKVAPSVTYSYSDGLSASQSLINNRRITTDRLNQTDVNISSPIVELDVFYNHRFTKQGRNLSVSMRGEYNQRERQDRIRDFTVTSDSTRNVANPLIDTASTGFRIDDNSQHNSGMLQVSFLEPLDERKILEFNYEFNYTSISNGRGTWNTDPDEYGRPTYPVYIDSLSIDFAYFFQASKGGINYRHVVNDNIKYNLGFAVQPTLLSGYALAGDDETATRHLNFIPTAGLNYKVNRYSDFSVNYIGRNNQPSFYQIQPVRDVSNTQNEVDGNAALKAEFINTISLKYNVYSLATGGLFYASLAFNNIQNKIVTDRSIISGTTRQQTSFRNTNGYFDMRGDYLWSVPLIGDVLKFSLNGTADYSNNISYIGGRRNLGRNLIYAQGVQFNFLLEDMVDTEFSTNYSINRTRNSLPLTANLDASFLSLNFGGKGYLGDKWTIGIDFSQRFNTGFSDAVNANPTLLNAYLERTFLRNDMALIRFQGFDLFNENTGVSRMVTANDILDVRNNRLARYFMLSLNIRLQRYPPKT